MNIHIYIFYSKNKESSMDIIQRLDAYLYNNKPNHKFTNKIWKLQLGKTYQTDNGDTIQMIIIRNKENRGSMFKHCKDQNQTYTYQTLASGGKYIPHIALNLTANTFCVKTSVSMNYYGDTCCCKMYELNGKCDCYREYQISNEMSLC
jgi:hypothetical protein